MDDADITAERMEREEQERMEREEQERMEAFRAARTRYTPEDSANECEECGEVIPSARQIAVPGCMYCAVCARMIEEGKL